tara:strand:+ start:1409 stop:1546 length:138 start_codon:yes stop_codon:yes gene_type:complete
MSCWRDSVGWNPKKRQERRMNDYVEELIELQSQQWDDDVEDAEEM